MVSRPLVPVNPFNQALSRIHRNVQSACCPRQHIPTLWSVEYFSVNAQEMRFLIVFFLSGYQRQTGGDVVKDRLTGIHCHPLTLKYSTTGIPFVFPSGESYCALMCAPS
jgi:hypothetical protein